MAYFAKLFVDCPIQIRELGSIVFRKVVFALSAAMLALALSACSKPAGSEMPTVTSPQFGTVPEITFPNAKPPLTPVLKVLDKGNGTGATVGENDLVVLDYYGKIWKGSQLPDSTITDSAGPRAISLANPPIEGWKKLVGSKVGQRLLLIVPPEQAYGEAGSKSIGVAGGDTLTYVVDIRAAVGLQDAANVPFTPTNETLPNGVQVTQDGNTLTLNAAAGSPPATATKTIYGTGTGTEVSNNQAVIVHKVTVNWGESSSPQAWESMTLDAIPVKSLDIEGLKIGSVAVVVSPAGLQHDATVTLLQVVSAYGMYR